MFNDLLKHQSLSKICNNFVGNIRMKYNNKITVGEYMIERFIHKKINVGFGYAQNYHTPFLKTSNNYSNFDIVLNNHEESTGYCALTYAKHTNNIGVMLSTNKYGFINICKPLEDAHYNQIPLLLMSFYYQEAESKLGKYMHTERKYLKDYYTINECKKFPNLFEYMLMISELPRKGPVHLNICNNILKEHIDLDDIVLKNTMSCNLIDEGSQTQNRLLDTEELSLLQYYEKKYEELETKELLAKD